MDFKNFLNYIMVNASNNLIESLNLNRECTASIITSLAIHIGSEFLSQDWRVLSSSMVDSKNDNISQRLIISPKDNLDSYMVIDICIFQKKSHWNTMLEENHNNNYDEIISESEHYILLGIAEGKDLISEELKCNDTLILPSCEDSRRRILWYIR